MTSKNFTLNAVKRNLFLRRRLPNPSTVIPISKAVKFISKEVLAKEISYSISTPLSQRLIKDYYLVAYNSTVLPRSMSWDTVAVIKKDLELTSFDRFICVDFSAIYSSSFKLNQPILISLILSSLKSLVRI